MLNSVTTAGETRDYWSSVTVSEVTVHTHVEDRETGKNEEAEDY